MRPGTIARPGTPNRRFLRTLAIFPLLVAAPGLAGRGLPGAEATPPAVEPEERPLVDPELQRQQSEIAAGFMAADADRVARLLSPRLKTYVACHDLTREDGYYGADQLRLLLRRLFRERESAEFRIVNPVSPRQDGQAVLQATWSFREAGVQAPPMHLAFTLAREGRAWRLREIRDLS